MRSALLCNGPSRTLYPGKDGYDYVMGCNIPWAEVDGLTMVDVPVARHYATHAIPNCKVFMPEVCWGTLKHFKIAGVKATNYIIETDRLGRIIEVPKELYSSGHMAALELIRLGSTEIDIYGCDSYFANTVESSTWDYIKSNRSEKRQIEQLNGWKVRWDLIKAQNEIIINIIGS